MLFSEKLVKFFKYLGYSTLAFLLGYLFIEVFIDSEQFLAYFLFGSFFWFILIMPLIYLDDIKEVEKIRFMEGFKRNTENALKLFLSLKKDEDFGFMAMKHFNQGEDFFDIQQRDEIKDFFNDFQNIGLNHIPEQIAKKNSSLIIIKKRKVLLDFMNYTFKETQKTYVLSEVEKLWVAWFLLENISHKYHYKLFLEFYSSIPTAPVIEKTTQLNDLLRKLYSDEYFNTLSFEEKKEFKRLLSHFLATEYISRNPNASLYKKQQEFYLKIDKETNRIEQGLPDEEIETPIKDNTDLIKEITFNTSKDTLQPSIQLNSLESLSAIEKADLMHGIDFEHFIANLFKEMGFSVENTLRYEGRSINFIAELNGSKVGIKTKCTINDVSKREVENMFFGRSIHKMNKCIFVTNNYFTQSAIHFAKSKGIELWDRDILKDKIEKHYK